jgi:hypothetical protein
LDLEQLGAMRGLRRVVPPMLLTVPVVVLAMTFAARA